MWVFVSLCGVGCGVCWVFGVWGVSWTCALDCVVCVFECVSVFVRVCFLTYCRVCGRVGMSAFLCMSVYLLVSGAFCYSCYSMLFIFSWVKGRFWQFHVETDVKALVILLVSVRKTLVQATHMPNTPPPVAIIISPLVALMRDQVSQLRGRLIKYIITWTNTPLTVPWSRVPWPHARTRKLVLAHA